MVIADFKVGDVVRSRIPGREWHAGKTGTVVTAASPSHLCVLFDDHGHHGHGGPTAQTLYGHWNFHPGNNSSDGVNCLEWADGPW